MGTIRKVKQAGKVSSKKRSRKARKSTFALEKSSSNPVVAPIQEHSWESQQTFNPGAVSDGERVHLLYRAVGDNGLSVIGYAASRDGVMFEERAEEPVYVLSRRPDRSIFDFLGNIMEYSSGGSWGGAEDPRVTKLGKRVYMVFVAFDEQCLPRLALTSIHISDFLRKRWRWKEAKMISAPGVIDKSGCLFPEKIQGKYVILHRVFPNILIDFVDNLDWADGAYLKGEFTIPVRKDSWDSRKIGAGAPPIKTPYGWLLIYYGVDERDSSQYKVGAMLLDLTNPARVLYRSNEPILEPTEWYENEGNKRGVAYPCGAVVKEGTLFVYYGCADSFVGVATANLDEFLQALMRHGKPIITRVRKKSLSPKKP